MYVNIWYCVVSLNNLLNFWSEFAHHDEVAQEYIYIFFVHQGSILGGNRFCHKHFQVILSHWCFSLLLIVRLCIMIQCSCLKRCSHAPSVSEMSERVSGPSGRPRYCSPPIQPSVCEVSVYRQTKGIFFCLEALQWDGAQWCCIALSVSQLRERRQPGAGVRGGKGVHSRFSVLLCFP